jgi:hypothetical protein
VQRDGIGFVIKGNFDRKYFVRRHRILNSGANIFVFGCHILQQSVFITLKTPNIAHTFYGLSTVAGVMVRQLLEQ